MTAASDTEDLEPQKIAVDKAEEQSGSGLLFGLSAGHGVKHFAQGSFLILMPDIRTALSLSDIAVGGMFTAQQIASGFANIPAGFMTDFFRRQLPIILFSAMSLVGLGYLLVGFTDWYWLLLIAAVIIGIGTSMWHAPAFGALAARYPKRRGFAMAAHLTGAQIGNTTAPVIVGVALAGFTIGALNWDGLEWRTVSILLILPTMATAFAVLFLFRNPPGTDSVPPDLQSYFAASRKLVTNYRVLSLVGLQAIRGAVHQSFQIFLVLYLSEELDYDAWLVGLHISLITLAGIGSTPLMGIVSDRIGRKPVIVGAMAVTGILLAQFLWIESGFPLAIALTFLGLVLFAVMPIIAAAAMDQTEKGSEGSSIALMFEGGAAIGASAPIAAGAINSVWGFHGVVWFCVAIAATGTVLSLIVPMRRSA